MPVAFYLIAIAGLAALMIVHELGHYVAARRFKMHVTKFSIGLGPTIWKHQPRGSSTVFQVALIPFVAYVQIAGMNPYEESDPDDPESYANASLWGRIVTIAGGPLANYFFASVLIFAGLLIGGKDVTDENSTIIQVIQNGPAYIGGLRDGDRVLEIQGTRVNSWEDLRNAIGARAGEPTDVLVVREDGNEKTQLHKSVTPTAAGEAKGRIQVRMAVHHTSVRPTEAIILGIKRPPEVVIDTVRGIGRWIAGKEKADPTGPVGMVKEIAGNVALGPGHLLQLLGALSAYLGAFNLLPIPALDGGRLLFLTAEAVSRRKLNAKIEQGIHAVGLLMLLALIAAVTVKDVTKH